VRVKKSVGMSIMYRRRCMNGSKIDRRVVPPIGTTHSPFPYSDEWIQSQSLPAPNAPILPFILIFPSLSPLPSTLRSFSCFCPLARLSLEAPWNDISICNYRLVICTSGFPPLSWILDTRLYTSMIILQSVANISDVRRAVQCTDGD